MQSKILLLLFSAVLAGCAESQDAVNNGTPPSTEPDVELPEDHSETGTWTLSAPTLASANAAFYDFQTEGNVTITMDAYAGQQASVTVELYKDNRIIWDSAGAIGERATGTTTIGAGEYRAFAYMSFGAMAPYELDVRFSLG